MSCDQMPDERWLERHEFRCYFYPARDCPGWQPGEKCGRIDKRIPEDEDRMPETGDW